MSKRQRTEYELPDVEFDISACDRSDCTCDVSCDAKAVHNIGMFIRNTRLLRAVIDAMDEAEIRDLMWNLVTIPAITNFSETWAARIPYMDCGCPYGQSSPKCVACNASGVWDDFNFGNEAKKVEVMLGDTMAGMLCEYVHDACRDVGLWALYVCALKLR